jgi:D-alanyl-D-alanine carboxypeptidase
MPAALIPYIKKPWFAPGTGWAYSNTNYLLLGLIAERATGTPFPALVRTRILDPLGLTSLYTQVAEPARGSPAKGYDFASLSRTAKAVPWSDGTRVMPFTAVTSAAGAAGAMAGTAADVARWGLALYGGGFLSASSLAAMLSFDGTAAPGAASDYGLGAGRRLVGERLTYGHSGRVAGFRGVVRWVPELGVSIAVLTNQDRYDPDRVVQKLLGALAPIRPEPSPTPMPSPSPVPSTLPTPEPPVVPTPLQ